MADYCKQCSERIFGYDGRDLGGLCRRGETTWELCEGCGDVIEVDHHGSRVDHLDQQGSGARHGLGSTKYP